MASAEEIRGRTGELFRLFRAGKLDPTIDREFLLADAAEAHRYLGAGKTRGKLLLRVQ
jgi:NADPH2:quinone reductase